MRKTIQELWYGNIVPQDMCKRGDPRIDNLLSLLARNRKELSETLTEAQKEALQKYDDNNQELTSITESEIFVQGFRLGMRLAIESFSDDEPKDTG